MKVRIQVSLLNFLLLSGVCVLLQACQTSEETSYYSNGNKSRVTPLLAGKKHGIMIDYYPSGNVKSKREFKMDVQDGPSSYYHRNGTLKEVQYFQNGKQENGDTLWDENGIMVSTIQYENGKKNGEMRKYGSRGEILISAIFNMDSIVDIHTDTIMQTH